MIDDQIVIVYSLQVTGSFYRGYIGRRAVLKVNSMQVTGVFYRSYGWHADCNKSIQHAGNRNILQGLYW